MSMENRGVENLLNLLNVPRFGPLSGIVIIDTCRYGACHLATELLAELGAVVIHIETPPFKPPYSDSYRFAEFRIPPHGEVQICDHGAQNGRNKLSVALDFLNSDVGKEIFLELIKHADAYVESSRPGTLDKHGLSDDILLGANPRLVIVHLSAWGQTGPKRYDTGHDLDIQAFTGFLYQIGYENEPLRVPWTIADYGISPFLAFATLAAIYYSKRTGLGQVIDAAQYELFLRLLDPYLLDAATYQVEPPERMGNDHPYYFPYGVYKCKDGWITISAPFPATWPRLRKLLGLPPEYDDENIRRRHRQEINRKIEDFLKDKTREEAVRILQQNGVPASVVHKISELINDPHVLSRGILIEWEDQNIGRVKGLGVVPKFSRTPGMIWRGFPRFGQDTCAVLRTLLNFDDDKLIYLHRNNVIYCENLKE